MGTFDQRYVYCLFLMRLWLQELPIAPEARRNWMCIRKLLRFMYSFRWALIFSSRAQIRELSSATAYRQSSPTNHTRCALFTVEKVMHSLGIQAISGYPDNLSNNRHLEMIVGSNCVLANVFPGLRDDCHVL